MKKILVLMLIATMMITSLLALSAAKDETKSIKSTINVMNYVLVSSRYLILDGMNFSV
jgi:predicted transglutaminase-like protease